MADQCPRTKAALAPRGIERRGNARRTEIRRPIELRAKHEQRPERPQQSSRDGVSIGHRAVIPGAGKSFAYVPDREDYGTPVAAPARTAVNRLCNAALSRPSAAGVTAVKPELDYYRGRARFECEA